MKNFIKTLVILFVCFSAFGQTTNFYQQNTKPGNFSIRSRKINSQLVQDAKNQLMQGRNGRGIKNIMIDYDAIDEVSCTDSAGVYDRFVWDLHSQFPDDSSYNFNYNWTAVSFDTLVDATDPANPVSYPYNISTVTIDSIVVIAAHENFTGTPDSIIIKVLDYFNGNPSGTLLSGLRTDALQEKILNNVLYADTIVTTTSITPGLANLANLIIRPNLTLSQGQKFLVSVEFYGDTANDFYFYSGYCDLCGETCIAESSIFEDNTVSRWIRWQQGSSFTGRDNDIFFPCGRTPPPFSSVPGNCEEWYVQNTNILAFVSINVPFTATISQNVNNVCPGESVPLSVSYIGESDPNNVTVEWEPQGDLSNPFGNSTDATVDSTTTFTATIIDAGGAPDTIVKTVTITTRGVSIDAGPDVQVVCGGTANLLAIFTFHPGGQAGATFNWSNNVLTLNNNNVGPGTYCITVDNNYDCTASDCVTVSLANITQNVSFTSNVSGNVACKDSVVSFTNTSAQLSGWNWRWTFSDDPNGFFTSQNANHVFTAVTGTNRDTVTLRADSASGACVLTFSQVYQVVNCFTGVAEANSLDNLISIYPNPTEGVFNIDFKSIDSENGLLSVYDVHGKKVYDYALNVTGDLRRTIDLSKFAEGIYLVRIQLGSEALTKKLHVSR